MNKKLQMVFNEQIKNEFYSAYLYLSMANYFASKNLKGCSHWMRIQVNEETEHAIKMLDFLIKEDSKVILQTIPQPPTNFSSPRVAFEKTLAHEKKVTTLIHNLSNLAKQANNKIAHNFLNWFIKEQVEEEKNATNILNDFKTINNLSKIDNKLAKRKA
ncbi:MAG: ferritin [Planctomycetota bacterium]